MTMISHKLQSVTTFTNTDITLNPVNHHFRCSRLHFKNFEVPEKEKTKTIRSMYFSHFTYQWCVGTECLYASMTYTAVIKDRWCRGSMDTPRDITDLYHKWACKLCIRDAWTDLQCDHLQSPETAPGHHTGLSSETLRSQCQEKGTLNWCVKFKVCLPIKWGQGHWYTFFLHTNTGPWPALLQTKMSEWQRNTAAWFWHFNMFKLQGTHTLMQRSKQFNLRPRHF